MKNIKIIIVVLLTIVVIKSTLAQRFVPMPIPVPYHANNVAPSYENLHDTHIVIIAIYLAMNAFIILCYIARHFILRNKKKYREASFFEKTFYEIEYDYEDINILTISTLTVNGIAILVSLIVLFTKILS